MSPPPLSSTTPLLVTVAPLRLIDLVGGAVRPANDVNAEKGLNQVTPSTVEPYGIMSPLAETEVVLPAAKVTLWVTTRGKLLAIDAGSAWPVTKPSWMVPSGATRVPP